MIHIHHNLRHDPSEKIPHRVVKLLEPSYSQKPLHAHSVLQKETDEVDTVVDQSLHHRVVKGGLRPRLKVTMFRITL